MNVSSRSVARAKKVLNDGIAEVASAVDNGTLPVAEAVRIVRQPQPQQQDALQARLENKNNKQKNKKTNGTNSSTKTPTPAQPAETAPTEQLQAATGARAGDSATVTLLEADNTDGAALVEFANFILPRIAGHEDTVVITVTAEDVDEFNVLADRVRSVINQED
jgi:hypothetical protein